MVVRMPTPVWTAFAVALLALLAPGASPRADQPPKSTNFTFEEREGDDGKPVGRRMAPDEGDLGIEPADSAANVARPADDDAFYVMDEPEGGTKLPPLPPGKDIVTCLAGCNGPPGSIVYKK